MAPGAGFEPTRPIRGNGSPARRLGPLGHPGTILILEKRRIKSSTPRYFIEKLP